MTKGPIDQQDRSQQVTYILMRLLSLNKTKRSTKQQHKQQMQQLEVLKKMVHITVSI